MKFKMIICDFDGTLGSRPDVIEEGTVKAIKEYISRGGIFVICTGRMFASAKLICLKYGLDGIVVSYQGASIDDLSTGKSLLREGVDYKLAVEVAKKLKADGASFIVDIDEIMYTETTNWYTDFHSAFTDVVMVDDIVECIEKLKRNTSKLVVVDQPENINRLTKKYQDEYGDTLTFNNGADTLMEVVNPTYTKGNAVRFLSNYFNIPLNEIMTVGDSTNDIPLLDGEWYGVAVGDAKDQLKKVAKEITLPFKDNPVKHLIEKYCL